MLSPKPIIIGLMAYSCISLSTSSWSQSLKEVVKDALNNHPEAKAGLSVINAEREKVDIALSGYLPSLDVSASIGGQKRLLPPGRRDASHDKSYTRKEGSVALKQSIFAGFNTLQKVAQARHISVAETYRLGATLEELALKITNAYLKVLEHSELLELAEDNLKLHDDIYQQVRKRAEQGLARSSDLAQIKGRRARANANVINAKNNLADAQSEYFALVGSMPVEPVMPDIENMVLPETIESLLPETLREHPAILATHYEVMAAEADYKAQKSRFFPSLDVDVEQSWKTNADGQLNTTQDLQVMARLRYNLFRGGSDLSQIKESAYRAEEKRSQKDRLTRTIEEKLRLAWDSYRFLGEQMQYLHQHEEASKKTVEAYREQFFIGKRTLLDLLDTENELFQSSKSLTQAIYQETYSRYRVLSASGNLLNAFGLNWGRQWSTDSEK